MKKIFLSLLILCSLQGYGQAPICIGETFSMESTILKETRKVDIYLPPSYTNSQLQPSDYPVIYLLDAENNFRYFTTLMEKLTQGIPSVPEFIIIGIENTQRERDLTPISLPNNPENTGGNPLFLSFLKEEVVPMVKEKYRCKDFRILVGHSLSGLATINALITETELFNVYIAHDPSLWWNNNYGLELFEKNKGKDFLNRILYISHSEQKKRDNGRERHVASLQQLEEMFFRGDFQNIQWKIVGYPKENHGSIQIIGNLNLIRDLFSEMFIDRSEILKNPSIIDQRYQALSEKLHYPFSPSELYLNNTARWLENSHKKDIALQLLKENAKRYPNSSQAKRALEDFLNRNPQ
jgi:putative esterase